MNKLPLQAAKLPANGLTNGLPEMHKADLAPLLDTIFLVIAVLLVALLHMTPVEGIPANRRADGRAAPRHERQRRVEVVLPAEGRPRVEGRSVDAGQVLAALEDIESQRQIDAVYLLAHTEVRYGAVAELLTRLQRPDHPPVFLGVKPPPATDGN